MSDSDNNGKTLDLKAMPRRAKKALPYLATIWFIISIAVTTGLSIFALHADQDLLDSIQAGEVHFQAIATAAGEAASYVKRAETHLYLHLMLDSERDGRVFPERIKSLRHNLDVIDSKANIPEARALYDKMRVGTGEMERLGHYLAQKHDEALNSGKQFDPRLFQEELTNFNEICSEVRTSAIQLATFEIELHNRIINEAAKNATEIKGATEVLILCGSLFILLYGLLMALLVRRMKREMAEREMAEQQLRQSQERLQISQEELRRHRDSLEEMVNQRTQELSQTVALMQKEVEQRETAQAALLEAKDQAEQANRAKTDFLANMSHEFRTPLTHILGFADVLREGIAGPMTGQQVEFLNYIISSSNHLHTMVNDLLDMAKLETGRLELKLEPVSLEALLDEAVKAHALEAKEAEVTLEASWRDLPPAMELDPGKINQVINNLLANAIKFSARGWVNLEAWGRRRGWPEAGLGRDRPHVEIVVSDSGVGIEAKDLQRIFRPFEQVDSSSVKQFNGSGLGLALARNLVQMHGGHLWAESRGVGQGSQFHLVLPWDVSLEEEEP